MSATAIAKSSSSGVGFGTLLTLLFVALKLTNVITWSWWWVLAPTWIPLAYSSIGIIIGIIAICFGKANL